MNEPRDPEGVRDAKVGFSAQPAMSREAHVAWLRAELQKGLDSGVDPRPSGEIIEEIIKRHRTHG